MAVPYALARILLSVLCLTTAPSVATSNTTSNITISWTSPVLKPPRSSRNLSDHTDLDAQLTASTSSITGGLGGFIAAGMGMSSSPDTTLPRESAETVVPISDSRSNKSASDTPTMTAEAALASAFANFSDPFSSYRNLSFTGECFNQWGSYWTASSSLRSEDHYTVYETTAMATVLYTEYTRDWSDPDWTTWTETQTVSNGAFAQTTLTTVRERSIAKSWPISTYETLSKDYIRSTISFEVPTITAPACMLPEYVPACQSSWEAWISRDPGEAAEAPASCDRFASVTASSCLSVLSEYDSSQSRYFSIAFQRTPACTQAVITGSYCSETISAYLHRQKFWKGQSDGVVGVGESVPITSMVGNKTITTHDLRWPSATSLVPGCTLGCQACQINGGTVQLIYWPPMSSTWIDGLYSAITGNSPATSTVVTLGTTLTSPTVYVSFDSLYARDSCSAFGKTYYDEIVAITDTATLSSIYGWGYINGIGSPASFNFTDLYVSPVPDKIYESQPRCASSLFMTRAKGPRPSGWTCPRIFPYEPILAIPAEVRHIDPGWEYCNGSINGVYDPPIALTPADSVAKPTISSANSETKVTSTAVPAFSPEPTVAPVTSPSPSRPSSKTDPPRQSPGSVGEPSPSQTRNSVELPGSVEDELTQGVDKIDDGRSSPKPEPDHPVQSAKDDTPPPSQGSRPVEPNTGSSGTAVDDGPPNGKNALSVLSEAQSSAAKANTPEPSAKSTHDVPPSNDPAPSTDEPTYFTIALADGSSATVRIAGSSVKITQHGLSASAMPGSEVTIGTHVFSAAPQGNAIIVDHTATHTIPLPASSRPDMTFSADGRILSANLQDGKLLIANGHKTFTAHAGETVTIGSQTISIGSNTAEVILGTKTLTLPTKGKETPAALATAMWTADGSILTAFKQSDSIVVQGSDGTTTLRSGGAPATVGGDILRVPASGDGWLVIGGETLTFSTVGTPSTVGSGVAVTTLLPDGQELVASVIDGESIRVRIDSSSNGGGFTLTAGERIVINGEIVRVGQGGGVFVVGSETISLSFPASITEGSSSGSTGVSGQGGTSTGDISGPESAGETATIDGEGRNDSASQETESFSGGVGRGYLCSLPEVLLCVCAVACLV